MSETTKQREMPDSSALLGSTAGEDAQRQSPRRGMVKKMFCDCGESEYWCAKGCEMPDPGPDDRDVA